MRTWRTLTLVVTSVAAAAVAWSCDRPSNPVAAGPERPRFWFGECSGESKFTGGGRIDPTDNTMTGKVTFGFNIHASSDCSQVLKGQFEVVHHPSQTKYHSVSFDSYASFNDPDMGQCFELTGTFRAKHANGGWHDHPVFIQACDKGEPGSSPGTGPDTFWFATTDGSSDLGHGDTGPTPLTGGNIQAH